MVKGVHRKAIEILQPEDPCFERAIFFLSPKGELDQQVQSKARDYLRRAGVKLDLAQPVDLPASTDRVCPGLGGGRKRHHLAVNLVAGVKKENFGKIGKGDSFLTGGVLQ